MVKNNSFFVHLFLVLVGLAIYLPPVAVGDQPNVIFVMPDDISHYSFSYYKADGPRTPNIDGLAAKSVRLTDFHVSPTCSPTRACLMTGRYNAAAGVWHTIYQRNQLAAGEITMPEVFKHNGYATGLFWKWHLGDNYPFRPKDRGFEHVVWTKGGGVGQSSDYWGNMQTSLHAWINDELVEMKDEDDGIEGSFSTNFFFSRAMEWMEVKAKEKKPFFAYIPTATVHDPFHLPPDAREGVDAVTGSIENIDKNMGRLLKFLDDKGLAENTILVFTTDNGGKGDNTPLRGGKGSQMDGGSRVPCFVRWPAGGIGGEGQGMDVKPLTAHIDWLPTFMDMCDLQDVPGRPKNLSVHGQSFRNFMDSDPTNDPGPKFKSRAVVIENMRTENLEKYKKFSTKKDIWDGDQITAKWRLVRGSAKGRYELYDVATDPAQTTNMIESPDTKEIVEALKADYEEYWKLVEPRIGTYTRIILGNAAEPETQLNSHDFHGRYLWNHAIVAQGTTGSGFIAVEFDKPGAYEFDLRRWPKEIEDETTLTTAPEGVVYDGIAKSVPLDIASARIKIWNGDKVYFDERKDAVPMADGIPFVVAGLPKGPAFIQTWFYNSKGDAEGAVYYNYARRIDAPTYAELEQFAGAKLNTPEFKAFVERFEFYPNHKRERSWGSSFGVFIELTGQDAAVVGVRPIGSGFGSNYPGELPAKLKPDEPVKTLLKKLGKPVRTTGKKSGYYTLHYDGFYAVATNGSLFELWIAPTSEEPEARQPEARQPKAPLPKRKGNFEAGK